ncbi:MAG: crosslink repair DNA glycosylase YcaQ family protein [Myxococcota bacterium]
MPRTATRTAPSKRAPSKRTATRNSAATSVDLPRARAFWLHQQGLSKGQSGTVEDVITRTGWLRTLGGVDAYLAALARVPTLEPGHLDDALKSGRVQVTPAVRGCMYVVPRAHVPLVMKVAETQSLPRLERDLEKAGVPRKEVDEIARGVLAALKKAPLSTEGLRKALPAGLVRSLGERGKKVGMSSALPVALRFLEFEGKIVRLAETGRLDTERYVWRVAERNPFEGADIPRDTPGRVRALAEIFVRQFGPVTAKEFSAWSGFGVRDGVAAFAQLPVTRVAVEGHADDAVVLDEHVALLREGAPHDLNHFTFLPGEDNVLTVHDGPALLTHPRHHDVEIAVWGNTRGSTLGTAKHIGVRTIISADGLLGFWDYDATRKKLALTTLEKLPAARQKALEGAAHGVASFLTTLGHARSFSLDTDEEVARRAQAVRDFVRR